MITSIRIGDTTVQLSPVENGFKVGMLGGKGTSASIGEMPRRDELKTGTVEAHVARAFAGGAHLHVLQRFKNGKEIGGFCLLFQPRDGITRFEHFGNPEIQRGEVEKEMEKLVKQPGFNEIGSTVDFQVFSMAVKTVVRE